MVNIIKKIVITNTIKLTLSILSIPRLLVIFDSNLSDLKSSIITIIGITILALSISRMPSNTVDKIIIGKLFFNLGGRQLKNLKNTFISLNIDIYFLL
jgi:hypothetical protein